MTGADTGRLVAGYLRELEHELADLPRARRTELLEEIEEHIDEAIAEAPPANEAEVRTLLDRIGEPADIAEEARERFGTAAPQRRGYVIEYIAILMLTVGSLFVPLLGWLIGVTLLWTSPRWTREDKVLGTLIVPTGLFPAFYFWLVGSVGGDDCRVRPDPNGGWIEEYCMSAPGYAIGIFLVVAPLAMAFYLERRIRRS